ncbi:MAG: hypothetical protein CL920_34170 [Deltaproteobacteria bacterium]|nr:hypothetical protein [Deltaproteobacteria bacterium]MBU53770.1 hypothetical protein [Deltaproteobacteria bacterium]|tara:strand:+ start:960 stop:3872 length:2913 start_codon:yes stop_codon:yes gene_type:complete
MTAEIQKRLADLAQKSGASIEQIQKVYTLIHQEDTFTDTIILREIEWFFHGLGLDQYYFDTTPASLIAKHIQSLYAAKILDQASGEKDVGVHLHSEREDIALYVCKSQHQLSIQIERRIEEKYPDYRLQSYRTTGTLSSEDPESFLRFYFLTPPNFGEDNPNDGFDINTLSAKSFLRSTKPQTIERYKRIIRKAEQHLGPIIEISDKPETNEKRVTIAHHRGSTHSYFSAVSDVLNSYNIQSNRKYVEQFANNVVVYSIYFTNGPSEEAINNLREDISLVYVLPRTSVTPLFREGKLSAQEAVYAYAGWKFAHQFLTRYNQEYIALARKFRDDPIGLGLLNQFKHRLNKDSFTEGRIAETIFRYPELIKELYKDFHSYHFVSESITPKAYDPKHNEELQSHIKKSVSSNVDELILSFFLHFNRHIIRTNFYKNSKVALAFRLDPVFLGQQDYPTRPFGIFFMVGSEFRGFHVRFRDIARGGIRIIRSNNRQAFSRNIDFLFDENYDLAHTQQKKNKDIPEGGSKGTVLLSLEHQDKATVAFKKYIDCMLDLLMPNEEIMNHDNNKEILFLGPDEGTAELMDWASKHARKRDYPFWKAFTTGKSIEDGGIPHDLYGMTTRSIHQYVVGILAKLGVDEETITKFQTGGPDGDLGSNEIKISKDKTIAIVDGSGVLYDPNGIERQELYKLARGRQMVEHFDTSKLSESGFLINVTDRDISLPDGTLVESGLTFRNEFHLNPLAAADLFVPCGGRPEAIHINNVDKLFDQDGNPRFKYIVEGANLFLTQEARLALEKSGVVVFKDASANKGGVTSSSLEVLASLAFSDEEFAEHMAVKDGQVPEFYQNYIQEVHKRIKENADNEFECIWREHERTGTPRSILTDQLSRKINALNDQIKQSSLWSNESLKKRVLSEACPQSLLDKVGFDTFYQRVPENYLQAIFGAHLASSYVYKFGLETVEVQFIEFIQPYLDN